MKFKDNVLHNQATVYYFADYLNILKRWKNRKQQAFEDFMTGYSFTELPLERSVRMFLDDPKYSDVTKNHFQTILDSNSYIPENDTNTENYILGLEQARKFLWPTQEELDLRNQEEMDFQFFITQNPTQQPSIQNLIDQKEFDLLYNER